MSMTRANTGTVGSPSVEDSTFRGFEPITANFLYCPNQFLDICLPNYSRGVVRLVAFVLRSTLGWLDRDGDPIDQTVSVSYRDLVNTAGVSRGAARKAIEDAIAGGFIQQAQQGRAGSRGLAGQSASFELRWDHGVQYAGDQQSLRGFFAGEGHRTPIPNSFFDHVLPNETLAVIKITGAVLRHTVGYRNQFGHRSDAPLSYSYLQKFAGIADRRTLADALRTAIDRGYVCRTTAGTFHADPRKRQPARYAVRWLTDSRLPAIGSKTLPAHTPFKTPTSTSSETTPERQFRNHTKEKTASNDTSKQHAAAFALLCGVGFDERVARQLSETSPLPEIQKQIRWIEKRQPRRNRLGMLRRAIQEGWDAPAATDEHPAPRRSHDQETRQEQNWVEHHSVAVAEDCERRTVQKRRRSAWQHLSPADQQQYYEQAITQATSAAVRSRIRLHRDLQNPPTEVLVLLPSRIATT